MRTSRDERGRCGATEGGGVARRGKRRDATGGDGVVRSSGTVWCDTKVAWCDPVRRCGATRRWCGASEEVGVARPRKLVWCVRGRRCGASEGGGVVRPSEAVWRVRGRWCGASERGRVVRPREAVWRVGGRWCGASEGGGVARPREVVWCDRGTCCVTTEGWIDVDRGQRRRRERGTTNVARDPRGAGWRVIASRESDERDRST